MMIREAMGVAVSDDEYRAEVLGLVTGRINAFQMQTGAHRAGWERIVAFTLDVVDELTLVDAPGPVEVQVRADVGPLEELPPGRRTYATMAFRLARSVDEKGDASESRELRACLDEVWRGVKHERPSDRAVAGLDAPVLSAPVGDAA